MADGGLTQSWASRHSSSSAGHRSSSAVLTSSASKNRLSKLTGKLQLLQ